MTNECSDTRFLELLDLAADSALAPAEERDLEKHLSACPGCRAERAQSSQLMELLTAAQIEVDPEFQDRVLAELRPTGWEARAPRSWAVAVALSALFGAAAAVLAGLSAARISPAGSFVSAFSAVLGLFEASLLVGAGLLGASWRGLGLGLQELLAGSPMNIVALVAIVVGCNLFFFRLLRSTTLAIDAKRHLAATRSARSEHD